MFCSDFLCLSGIFPPWVVAAWPPRSETITSAPVCCFLLDVKNLRPLFGPDPFQFQFEGYEFVELSSVIICSTTLTSAVRNRAQRFEKILSSELQDRIQLDWITTTGASCQWSTRLPHKVNIDDRILLFLWGNICSSRISAALPARYPSTASLQEGSGNKH